MTFAAESAGVISLLREGSVLLHLNVSSNSPDHVGFSHLFWMVGMSKLEKFDAVVDMTQEWIRAPTRCLLFVLANPLLQRLNAKGATFGTDFEEGEVAQESPLNRAIMGHPLLRAFFLYPKHYRLAPDRPTATWTCLLYHALTRENLGGEEQVPSFTRVMQERDISKWAGLMLVYSNKQLN